MQDDAQVTRSVDVEAGAEKVWELLVDPDMRYAWLDDDDAAEREVRVDEARPGESLTWTWWRPDDEAGASRVEIVLTELATGGTRVAVTERLLTGSGPVIHAQAQLQAQAMTMATTPTAVARVGFPTPWDRRLLGLELLLVAAGNLVAAR